MRTISRRTFVAASATAGLTAGLTAPALAVSSVRASLPALFAPFLGLWEASRRGRPPGPPPGAFHGPDLRPGAVHPFGPPPDHERRGGAPGAAQASEIPAELKDMAGLDEGDLAVWAIMTPAGRAAFAAQDARDLPVNNCRSAGLPHIAGAPGLQQWSYADGVLTIVHSFTPGTTRRIDMTTRSHPSGPHTADGHAVGWFEDGALVIETANLAATPGGLARNAPASNARVTLERYSAGADGQTLEGRMTLRDPKFLKRPVTRRLGLSRAEQGTELEQFPCSVEAAQRYLDY